MIDAIVKDLEGLKAKVQAAIDHAKAGVNHLNEDQQAALRELVAAVDHEAADVRDRVESIFSGAEHKAESLVERAEDAVKGVVEKVEGFFGHHPTTNVIGASTEPGANLSAEGAATDQPPAAPEAK